VPNLLEITSQTQLEEIKTSSNTFFLYFYTDWCQPCKIVMPQIEQLKKEYEKIKFVKVNIDKNKKICKEYHIDAIPSMMILKKWQDNFSDRQNYRHR